MDNKSAEKKVSQAELAQAFTGKPSVKAPVDKTPTKTPKAKKPKSLIISIIVFVVGIIALIAGLVVLILKFTAGAGVQDGEFLTQASEWVLEDSTNCASEVEVIEGAEEVATNCADSKNVIWKFTDIGKGTLTTNGHLDDYDFIWAIEGNKLKIETKWLYEIVNEYEYKLNQGDKILTLKDGEKEMVLVGRFAEN